MIFHHISQNLAVLRDQLAFIEDEDVQAMHDAVYTKYIMFKYVFWNVWICWQHKFLSVNSPLSTKEMQGE